MDQLFDYCYIGNSYFEGASLNLSLKQLITKELVIKKTDLKSSSNRGLFVICQEDQYDEIMRILPDLLNEVDVEEMTRLSDSLSDDPINGSKRNKYHRFECWWDIYDHYFLCLGKENARKIIKGVQAYKNKTQG